MIATISGPSGVGKTTLLNNVLHVAPHAEPLKSVTTRAPRPTDELSYEYVTEAQFDELERRGELLWAVRTHGRRYGTRKKLIDDALSKDLAIAVLVIDAVQKLHVYAHGSVRSLYIRIDDEAELRKRFSKRGDMTPEEVESRMVECRSWNKEAELSGVPFVYLDGKKSREELLEDALAALAL
ncbi:MAG: AAA family ATPase [Patescibacteria group bacterium]